MTNDMNDLLRSIQCLARTMASESGLYVTYTEHMHTHSLGAEVYVQHYDGETYRHEWFKGSTTPTLTTEVNLEEMHEAMMTWLVEHRKAKEAA